ncbi:MAG: tRNA threonylcarbamoyladenosine biosynthesis protein TsaB [Kiritimatiellia bacterium]
MSGCVLALEWSSSRISVAARWEEGHRQEILDLKRFQAEVALPMLESFLSEIPEPTELRVGRGPGNYSGIRQALAWSFGYCAPGELSLRAVSSGQAQARRIAGSCPAPFAVLGDARRGMWWGQIFGAEPDVWRLQTPKEWVGEIGKMPVFSQEAERLQGGGLDLWEDFPLADDLLDLPDSVSAEDPVPLYLHPPV